MLERFEAYLGSLKSETLRSTFERIKKYLEAQDKVSPLLLSYLSPLCLLLKGNFCYASEHHDAIKRWTWHTCSLKCCAGKGRERILFTRCAN